MTDSPQDSDELYCAMFVRGSCAHSELVEMVAKALKGTADGSWVENTQIKLDVMNSDDFDPAIAAGDVKRAFVYYPFKLEIDAKQGTTLDLMVDNINALIAALMHTHGLQVVAACDYEHLLIEDSYRERPFRA